MGREAEFRKACDTGKQLELIKHHDNIRCLIRTTEIIPGELARAITRSVLTSIEVRVVDRQDAILEALTLKADGSSKADSHILTMISRLDQTSLRHLTEHAKEFNLTHVLERYLNGRLRTKSLVRARFFIKQAREIKQILANPKRVMAFILGVMLLVISTHALFAKWDDPDSLSTNQLLIGDNSPVGEVEIPIRRIETALSKDEISLMRKARVD